MKISILCIHDIVEGKPDSPWELRAVEFEDLLYSLINKNYLFCGLDDIYNKPEACIVLTFDDAPLGAIKWIIDRAHIFKTQATIFPVINWLNSPPPFSPKYAYRSLASWADIKQVQNQGHIIGSHGMSHLPMHYLNENQIIYELKESKKSLEYNLGSMVNHFSAPYGKLSDLVTNLAFDLGYATICSTVFGHNSFEDISSSILKRFVLRSDLPNLGLPANL